MMSTATMKKWSASRLRPRSTRWQPTHLSGSPALSGLDVHGHLAGVLCACPGDDPAGQDQHPDVKQVIDDFYLGEAMLTILAFYFGGGMLEGVVGKVKAKMKGNFDQCLAWLLAHEAGS